VNGVGINLYFLQKIRYIMDSKYKDMVNNGTNYRLNTKFIDYVYWWLGKYDIEHGNKRLILRGDDSYFDDSERVM